MAGGTVRYGDGLTQEVLLERKFNLEIRKRIDPNGRRMGAHINQINMMRLNAQRLGIAARPGISLNTQTQAMQTFQNERISTIRQLMSEHEEGSLEMDILQRMLERAQNPPQNRPTDPADVPRPGGGGFNGTF